MELSVEDVRSIAALHHLPKDFQRFLLVDLPHSLDNLDDRLLRTSCNPRGAADEELHRGSDIREARTEPEFTETDLATASESLDNILLIVRNATVKTKN